VEVNISCPNVASGGMQFGTCPKDAAKVARHVRKATGLPVIVKLSPNVTDIAGIADAAAGEGADAVSAINTLLAMGAARQQDTPVTGGLSGPAIKPVALRMVWQLCRKVRVPVIGIGGISSLEDVLEFFSAGAAAVQIGTANLVDPMVCHRIVRGLEEMQ
jgi:dihydroorotate dehydrogenase (NAD+) catalytic subunit